MKALTILIGCAIVLWTACKKDSFITSADARLNITIDTLKYDTVFTSTGSVTQSFKIVNENDQKLRLSSVKLMGGVGSAFKINVDGIATGEANNTEIAANDSIYVFVQVKVDPSVANLPFVIRDSILISYNGNERWVQLEAWGQNAHFLRNKQIAADETWTNDLPYVILGYIYINENTRLTVQKGCRIYAHADAPIVVDGTLQVNGSEDTVDRVYFSGDRLDEPYKGYPASWPGIYFSTVSKNNVLNYAVIKNSFQSVAVQDPSPNTDPKVILNECVIDNSYDAGIISLNSSVRARNCLISNCGRNVVLIKGGDYNFTHCTIASISNNYIQHREPVLQIRNLDANNNSEPMNAIFRNCIFWGENGTTEDEVKIEKTGNAPFIVDFTSNIWKLQAEPQGLTINQDNVSFDPLFDSIDVSRQYYNFRLKDGSPAIDRGINAGIGTDLDGKPRPAGPNPDLGCFEKP